MVMLVVQLTCGVNSNVKMQVYLHDKKTQNLKQ